MKTKEAIEFLKFHRILHYDVTQEDGIDKVITLLKNGEKFEAMWEELCDRNVNNSDEYVYSWTEELFELMVNIQQKYFPEEGVIK